MKNLARILSIVAIVAMIGIPMIGSITGCRGISPATAAYRAEAITITSVDGAMKAWRDYVVAGNNVSQGQIDSVKQAYGKYYSAQMVSSNAFVAFYSANRSDTNAITTAKNNLNAALASVAASESEVISLVSSFTKKDHH